MKIAHIGKDSVQDYENALTFFGGKENCKRLSPKTFEVMNCKPETGFKVGASNDENTFLRILSAGYAENDPTTIEIKLRCAPHQQSTSALR